MKKVIIIGAGITGLSLAYLLLQEHYDVTLIEKEAKIGGLARSYHYDDFTFDIGPHRFFSTNSQVVNFIHKVLGNDYIEIIRNSAVHYLNKYHTWPLRLKSIFKLPPGVAFQAFLDLFKKNLYKDHNSSFENYILRKYGKTLYYTYFKDYSEKFLGITPAETHWHWAKMGVERATITDNITTGSISELLKLMLLPPVKELNFIYPIAGIDQFGLNLQTAITQMGGRVLAATTPLRLKFNTPEGIKIHTAQQELDCDYLVWTGSLVDLSSLLQVPEPQLQYLSLILFNLELKRNPGVKFQWCYYGSKDIIFSRISNPYYFYSQLVPKGKGALNIEITCQEGDPLWQNPETVTAKVIADLKQVKLIKEPDEVEAVHIEKIRDAYPIYNLEYMSNWQKLKTQLQPYTNLILAGRSGLFWYNNMDHSIENAFEVCQQIKQGS